MTTEREYENDSLGDFIADVVDSATELADRAAGSAVDLAAQAVHDARRVARSFEALLEAAAREGVEIARDTMEAVRDAVERAEAGTRRDAEDFGEERARWHADGSAPRTTAGANGSAAPAPSTPAD